MRVKVVFPMSRPQVVQRILRSFLFLESLGPSKFLKKADIWSF